MTFLKWFSFLLGSLRVILTALLFWIYLFLVTLVFVLQWLFLHWKIPIMLLSQFPLTFYQRGCLISLHSLWLFLCWLELSLRSSRRNVLEIFHGRISLNLMLLLLLVNFVSWFRLELIYTFLIVNTSSSLTNLHGFQLFLLLP